MLKYSVGLDISSGDIHCCLSCIDSLQKVTVKSSRKIPNTVKGFKDLVEWIGRNRKEKGIPLVICMEATGVYYENCALFLHNQGYTVSVILPSHAKKYLQSCGQKSKNDKIDARGLSRMGAEKALGPWQPMGEYFYQLRELTRQNQTLNELRTVAMNRLHAARAGMYQNKETIRQTKKLIDLLEQQLEESDRHIFDHIASSAAVAEKVGNICKMKGLGIKTVATVIAETNGFVLFGNARQLASFSGYDVVENQSGNHTGKTRISKKGNSHIRRILYMPALVAVTRKVKPFLNLYERTLAKHGIKMKSYVAVQKKMLTIIYALWKKNEAFEENYGLKKHTEKQEPVSTLG